MIFIDWVSTPDHKNFNRSFFSALALKNATCLVFSRDLIIPEVECILITSAAGRVRQALKVLKFIWQNRKESIVLLSYDPLFVPFASVIQKELLVFEHNTTPVNGFSKHLVWQKLFFGRVRRMAQFPAQYDRLLSISNKVKYIGSPIMAVTNLEQVKTEHSSPYMFLAPSYRANILELERYSELLNGTTIFAKKTVDVSSIDVNSVCNLEIHYLDRIEFFHNGRVVDGVIITVQSRIRGTGWFNDSISNKLPIIIIGQDTKALFDETFPGYPFISLDCIKDRLQLTKRLNQIRGFDTMSYVKCHNARIRKRFLDMCAELEIEIEC